MLLSERQGPGQHEGSTQAQQRHAGCGWRDCAGSGRPQQQQRPAAAMFAAWAATRMVAWYAAGTCQAGRSAAHRQDAAIG